METQIKEKNIKKNYAFILFNKIHNSKNSRIIFKYLKQVDSEERGSSFTFKRTCFVFLLLYLTKISLEEILYLKVKNLKDLINYNSSYFLVNKKNYYLDIQNFYLKLKDFSFLYEDLIKNKSVEDWVFTSLNNKKIKIKKK